MNELYITEQELDYLTERTHTVCEDAPLYGEQKTFEEAVKECNGITLEEFSDRIGEAIRRLIPE